MTETGLFGPFYKAAVSLLQTPISIGFPKRFAVFELLVNNPRFEHFWANKDLRWARGKINGYWIPCDMQVFSGRMAYFFKRWYELDTQSIIMSLLRENDTFIDIGGNVGMASLTAARAVGDHGTVVAFEPNPAVHSIFQAAIERNGLTTIQLNNAGISDEPGRKSLFVPDNNHGEASFVQTSGDRAGTAVETGKWKCA